MPPLNRDTLFMIALYLSPKDLSNFFLTNRLCHTINNSYFWSLKLKRDYHRIIDQKDAFMLYQRYYHFKMGKSRVIDIPVNLTYMVHQETIDIGTRLLPQVLQQHPKRGDTIRITGIHFVYNSKYVKDYHGAKYYLFDGEKLLCMYEGDNGHINEAFQGIQEFTPDYWLYKDGVDYSFVFNPKPYYDAIREKEKEKTRDDGWYESSFLSWNEVKYTLEYPDKYALQRNSSWYFKYGDRFHLICYQEDWDFSRHD